MIFRGMRYSPKITQKPTMTEAPDGSNLLIECRMTSDTQPLLAWLVNGAQVQDGGKYKLVFKKESGDSYFASLNISGTKKNDKTTKYEIKTKNDAGESSATVNSFLGWNFSFN